jgi:hypothetical protein
MMTKKPFPKNVNPVGVPSTLSCITTVSLQAWPILASAAAFFLICRVDQIQELAYIARTSITDATDRIGQGILVLAVFCISFETCVVQWNSTTAKKGDRYRGSGESSHIYTALAISLAFPVLVWSLVGFRFPDLMAIGLGVIYVASYAWPKGRVIALRMVLLTIMLVLMIIGVRLTVIYPEIARSVGTIGLTAIGFFLLGQAITMLFGLLPSIVRGRTAYLWVAPTILALGALYTPAEETLSDRHLDPNSTVDDLPSASEFTGRWLLDRQKDLEGDPDNPIYVVIAEGGGIRSAYWTANALNALDVESNGSFSRSTIAYSGISGGSIGIATFLACRAATKPSQCIEDTLGGDLLAPIVARLLFAEPIRLALRGDILRPRDDTFIAMLEEQSRSSQAKGIWTSGGWAQSSDFAIFFGSTDLNTGKRVTFSNISSPVYNHALLSTTDEASRIDPPIRNVVEVLEAVPKLSFASTVSARFPGISAPIKVDSHLLADGGYRENTGTEEVMPILDELSLLAKGRSSLTKIELMETDVPMGMMFRKDSELISDITITKGILEDLRADVARAIRLQKEIEPLIKSRPIRIVLLRNDFSAGAESSGGTPIEVRMALSGVLSARVAKTDDTVIALGEHVFRDNVTRGGHSLSEFGDSRYGDIPQEWLDDPDALAKSETVARHFLTTTFTNDYCHGDREAPLSDLVVLDLGKFVGGDVRVPLGWTLSSSTRSAIRQAAVEALAEKRAAIRGLYEVPKHVLENEDCAAYYREEGGSGESSEVEALE